MLYNQNSNIEIVYEDENRIVAKVRLGDNCVLRFVPLQKFTSVGYNSVKDFKEGRSVSFIEYGAFYRGNSGEKPISFPNTKNGLIAAKKFINENVRKDAQKDWTR